MKTQILVLLLTLSTLTVNAGTDKALRGQMTGFRIDNASELKTSVIRARLKGALAKVIYDQLDVEVIIADGPGGGQEQKYAQGLMCFRSPELQGNGYECIFDFGKKGLE